MRFPLAALCLLLTFSIAAQPRTFTPEDLMAMDRLSSPTPSPDGRQIVYVQRTTDLEANRGRTDLWLMALDGSGLRQLTTHEAGDSNPLWSPDGKTIYFLSSRSGSSQIWSIAVDGGEAQQRSDLPLDVANLKLSPDGSRFAFSLSVFADCEDLDCTVARLEEQESATGSGMVFDELMIRHWDTWRDGRRNHLFTMSVRGGEPVDLMAGWEADCPSLTWGGSEEFDFHPDGQGLVFTVRQTEPLEATSTNFDLYYASVSGGEPVNLTADNLAWDTLPVFSPDGKQLAYAAMREPGYEADRYEIMLRDWNGSSAGPARRLSENWDRSVGSLAWSPDGKWLLCHAYDLGERGIFRVDARSGETKLLYKNGNAGSETFARDRIVFAREDFRSPADIYVMRHDGKNVTQLTHANAELLAATARGEYEHFSFPGANSDEVYAWLIKPAQFDASKRYPVAFIVHGGPQGTSSNGFSYRWNPQTYSGAGYAVIMVDFHGSTGYGEAFRDAIQDNWGGWPLEDLQLGLQAALDRYAFLDGDRVAALGASYGGYMMHWMAGNWPDRFRCFVNHDGVFDLEYGWYATEELWFPERDMMGTPYDNPETYARWNPKNHIDNWQTPTLLIQGAKDYRVNEAHALAAFNVLQRKGIPSRLLWFPDENHWVLKPQNSLQWQHEVLAWLERWMD